MEQVAAAGRTGWIRAADGVVSILFGLAALFWPGITIGTLIQLYAGYTVVSGIVSLLKVPGAIEAHRRLWPHVALGLIHLVAGFLAFADPSMTAARLLFVIAAWALGLGIVEIAASVSGGGLLPMIAGVISILFALLLLAEQGAGGLILLIALGIFAIVRGIIKLAGGLRLPWGITAEED